MESEPSKLRAGFVLVCFAVAEEAKPFRRLTVSRPDVRTVLTGVGPRNAERSIRKALAASKPAFVLSSGLAGGLDPALATSALVFNDDCEPRVAAAFRAAGARAGRFHCSTRIATSVGEKDELRRSTRADAVEMESQAICKVCREQQVPCATLRVILDTAGEDLPLDFNQLMTADQQLSYGKLAWAMMRGSAKIGALLDLRRRTEAAASILAQALLRVLDELP